MIMRFVLLVLQIWQSTLPGSGSDCVGIDENFCILKSKCLNDQGSAVFYERFARWDLKCVLDNGSVSYRTEDRNIRLQETPHAI